MTFCTLYVIFLFVNSVFSSSDTLEIQITAANLSEDMSLFSTMNDEVMIFVYQQEDSLLNAPLVAKEFVLVESNRSCKVSLPTPQKDILLFIVERDDDVTLHQVDPIIRVHYQEIIEKYKANDRQGLEAFLGDEDLLGFKVIKPVTEDLSFTFEGFYKLDRYKYDVSLRRIE